MKRILSVVLCVLLLALTVTPALAQQTTNPANFDSTRSVLNAFSQKGRRYTDDGSYSDGKYERYSLDFNCDNIADGLTIKIYVGESAAHMYIWNIVTVAPAQLLNAYQTINQLNADYFWATFVLDTSDNTIQLEADLPYYTYDGFGFAVDEVMDRLISIADDEYAKLAALQ